MHNDDEYKNFISSSNSSSSSSSSIGANNKLQK